MNNKNRIILVALVAAATSFAGSPAQALSERETAAIAKSIKDAPAAELGVKAAEIVIRAAKKEKQSTAVAVVRAAIAKNAASAVSVVSSVVKAAPATAPAVAAAAAKLAPDQIEAIAAAAALAAPDLADKVVAALIDVNPKAEERVANAVMLAVPRAQARIRQQVAGHPEADHGALNSPPSPFRIDGSSFPATPPVQAYAGPGRDPGH